MDNMELCKDLGYDSFEDQDKNISMIMTVRFLSFGMNDKEGKYLPNINRGYR